MRSARRSLWLAAVFCAAPIDASGQNMVAQQDLLFGAVPQDSVYEIAATSPDAGRFRATLHQNACGPAIVRFESVPSLLSNGAGSSVPIGYHGASARVTQETAPNNFIEFNPSTGSAAVPLQWFPVIITIGGVVTTAALQPLGSYSGPIEAEVETGFPAPGGCRTRRIRSQMIAAELEVQVAMVVSAINGPIDLGPLFRGAVITVPSNGSGGFESAQFSATGPDQSWRLSVSTTDLQHATLPDTLPLVFTGGLYGTSVPPATPFSSGDIVPASAHGGALDVWLGYQVTVPPSAAIGTYQGSITLTVEVILN
jgi:hypothetical protein